MEKIHTVFPAWHKMTRKEKIIYLFTDEKPHLLSYEYRKKYSLHKEDLPILNELIKSGVVRKIEKTAKKITYEYTYGKNN